jgi:hypothetical protein
MQHPDYPNIELKPSLISYNLDQIYDLLVTNALTFPVARYFSLPLTNYPTVFERYVPYQYHWCHQYVDKLFDFAKHFNSCYYNDYDYEIQNIDNLYNFRMPKNFAHSNHYKKNESYNVFLTKGSYRFTWLVLITPFDNFLQYKYSSIVDQAFTTRNFEFDGNVDLNKIFKRFHQVKNEDYEWRCFCANSLVISKYVNNTWLNITDTLTYPKNFLAYSDIDEYFLEVKNVWSNFVNAYSYYFNGRRYDNNYLDFIYQTGFRYLHNATEVEKQAFYAKLKIPMPLGHYLAGLDCTSKIINNVEELTTIPVTAPIPGYIRKTMALVRANNNYWNLSLYPQLPDLGVEINQGEFNFLSQELWYEYKNLSKPFIWKGVPPYLYQEKETISWGETLGNFANAIQIQVFNQFLSNINPITINFNNCEIRESFSVSWFRAIQKYNYNGVNSNKTLWASLKRLSYPGFWNWETLNHSYSWRTTTDYFSGEILPGGASLGAPNLRGILYVPNVFKYPIVKHSFVPINEIMLFSMGNGFFISSEHIMAKITGYLIFGVSDSTINRFEINNIELLSYSWIDRIDIQPDSGMPILKHWDNLPYNSDMAIQGREILWSLEEWQGLLNYHKQIQQPELDYFNKVKTTIKEMSNSIKLDEVHASLGAGEMAYYIDQNGDTKPAKMHLGRSINLMAKTLGINFSLDGKFNKIKPPVKVEKNSLAAGWYLERFGINLGFIPGTNTPKSVLGNISIDEQQPGIVYKARANKFITDPITKQRIKIEEGSYYYCNNLLQVIELMMDDFDICLDLQNLGAGTLTINDQTLEYEGLLSLIKELHQTTADTNQTTEQTRISSYMSQQQIKEILKAIGLPGEVKQFTYLLQNGTAQVLKNGAKIDVDKVEIPYHGIAEGSPTIFTLFMTLLSNISIANTSQLNLKNNIFLNKKNLTKIPKKNFFNIFSKGKEETSNEFQNFIEKVLKELNLNQKEKPLKDLKDFPNDKSDSIA